MFRPKGFPMYACFGNGLDTWEVDFLHGGAHRKGLQAVENISTFKIRKKGKKWVIETIRSGGIVSTRPVGTKLHGLTSDMHKYAKNVAYLEARVLATSELKKLQKTVIASE